MKKQFAITMTLIVLLASLIGGAAAEETAYSGTLAWLNISEETYRSYAVRLIPATVYWTKGMPSETAGMTEAEYAAYTEKEMEGLPEMEKALLRAIDAVMSYTERSRMDMPEGTICTIPYYDDYMAEVIRK